MQQHQVLADPAAKRELASRVVQAKIKSQIRAARHYQRHGLQTAARVIRALQKQIGQCQQCDNLNALRGIEGAASNAWFQLLGELLVPPWQFEKRVRRPPTDPVNALLSLGYTLLLNRTVARCQAAGLEVNLGALHDYRPGRPSLACDLIEPLRVPAVDRWVIALCNQTQVQPEDFVFQNGGMRLHPERFTSVILTWEQQWSRTKSGASIEKAIQQFSTGIREFGLQSGKGVAS